MHFEGLPFAQFKGFVFLLDVAISLRIKGGFINGLCMLNHLNLLSGVCRWGPLSALIFFRKLNLVVEGLVDIGVLRGTRDHGG